MDNEHKKILSLADLANRRNAEIQNRSSLAIERTRTESSKSNPFGDEDSSKPPRTAKEPPAKSKTQDKTEAYGSTFANWKHQTRKRDYVPQYDSSIGRTLANWRPTFPGAHPKRFDLPAKIPECHIGNVNFEKSMARSDVPQTKQIKNFYTPKFPLLDEDKLNQVPNFRLIAERKNFGPIRRPKDGDLY
jgi:hypothetical protein